MVGYEKERQKLELTNEIIVKAIASMLLRVIAWRNVQNVSLIKDGKIVKGEGFVILEEKMKALNPKQNEMYRFLGWKQGYKIDGKKGNAKGERLEQLFRIRLTERRKSCECGNLDAVVLMGGYIMGVYKAEEMRYRRSW